MNMATAKIKDERKSQSNSSFILHPSSFHFLRPVLLILIACGLFALVAGLIMDPHRAWANVLVIGIIGVGLGLAAILLPALFSLTGATWTGPLQRSLRAMLAVMPWGAVAVLSVFFFCPDLYPWTNTGHEHGHQASAWQQLWLQWPFFLGRAVAYFAIWFAFAAVWRASKGHGVLPPNKVVVAVFVIIFALTWWLASCDWIMSLEPEWGSTMFGVYSFAGLFLGGLATLTLLNLLSQGRVSWESEDAADRLHDLGKLLFAFSTFWVYIWFCQYMLIWFVNIPEETAYYIRRLQGMWQPLVFVNVLLNWLVPFLILLPQKNKRDIGILKKACILLLLGRCLDVYLMILPAIQGLQTEPGLIDVGLLVGGAACFALVIGVRAQESRVNQQSPGFRRLTADL
jgi:hypothetical protein